MTTFRQINDGWNAEPNAPAPTVEVHGQDIILRFRHSQIPNFKPKDVVHLRFESCWRYRLGSTNDEGWYLGQCRFSRLAPRWGEFYEVGGDLRLAEAPNDWIEVGSAQNGLKHFLFYFKDETFECDAVDWKLETAS